MLSESKKGREREKEKGLSEISLRRRVCEPHCRLQWTSCSDPLAQSKPRHCDQAEPISYQKSENTKEAAQREDCLKQKKNAKVGFERL